MRLALLTLAATLSLAPLCAAQAAELPEVGPYDRYRVDVPDWPGAEATSPYGSVLLAPPPAGTPWRIEEAPSLDEYVPDEGFEALAVPPWHDAGYDGTGIKIAVFDVQWLDAELYPDELGDPQTHDCQAHPSCDLPMDTLRPRYSFEEGSHGVACAEVIHEIAPGAELHLVRVDGGTTLETAGAWAVREGIDLISMSMSFFNSSFYDGTGYVSGAAVHIADGGVLLVNSAGNYAEEHWDGTYVDRDGDGAMDFDWGSNYLPVYLHAPSASLLLSWDEYSSCGDSDFDAWVVRQDGVVVGRGEEFQAPGQDHCEPVERISAHIDTSDWYYLRILHAGGEPTGHLNVYARGGAVYQTTPGSLADPASSPSAFTVGAVRVGGYAVNGAEFFSSEGPTMGGADKPDIAGPDGLTTTIYGPMGFYGTSASTPAVTGTLALVMQQDPSLTPFEAAKRLQANAIGDKGVWQAWDGELGAGRARLWSLDGAPGCRGEDAGAWVLFPGLLWCARMRRMNRSGKPT